ncbi:MAG: zinc ribbon domain-containing protein [Clostridia bacterium]|nr:zinc ribbon domain-containing protein [Clostridia bacterium]
MKNCKYCGAEIIDEALFCPNCGANQSLNEEKKAESAAPEVKPSAYTAQSNEKFTGWTVLGFFFPLIALICYFVWKDTEPSKALAIGKGGLMSVSLSSPIIALVIYLVMKEQYPDVAKACGICGIIGIVVGVLSSILYFILLVALMMLA